ncbi:MAG: cysteine--tRNA ligase [Actinomycetota bacterium]
MAIQIYDTLQRSTVPFRPSEAGKVAMYSCGPTVYNYIHIGNARTFLWFDLIRRYLEYRGYQVTYVANYTDVDDKIIERAKLEDLPADGVTSKYINAYEQDMRSLGVRPPDVVAKATEHIGEMVRSIEGLVDKGIAYESDGDVWFAVEGFESYGKLSNRSLEDMRAGERIEPHEGKRYPLDFALWKSAKEGEPSWESPWGRGRPGWHIECSVMSLKYLGMSFDLHGGGSDLIFPHHENEIAQAEALEGSEPFARHWMHAGMVQMGTEKMSKSLGNVALAREVIERWGGDVVRYWCLSGSYRSQALFTESTVDDAAQGLDRWRTFYRSARHALGDDWPVLDDAPVRPDTSDATIPQYVGRFIEAMDDDFNSAGALGTVHDLVREGNRRLEGTQTGDENDRSALRAIVAEFLELISVLGFELTASEVGSELVGGLLDYLLELREQARSDRAFERADAIRDRLTELGVNIEDTPAGPRWRLP